MRPLAEAERDHLNFVLEQAGWRVEGLSGAAQLLGLKPSTLRSRMRKLGIERLQRRGRTEPSVAVRIADVTCARVAVRAWVMV